MTSLNVPKSTLQEPAFQEDPAVPRLGKMGPVYNEDIKTSTVELSQAFTRHRTEVPIFVHVPTISFETNIAPNATIVGDVEISDKASIMYGSVIRGDEATVSIGFMTCIAENCSITADSNVSDFSIDVEGTGGRVQDLSGKTTIGMRVHVGANCILRACTIQDNAKIGAGSVVCEGALVENGAVVGPGSVVPPGRRVPAGQMWEGNPLEYVREVSEHEVEDVEFESKQTFFDMHDHEEAWYPLGNRYNMLHKDAETAVKDGL